MAVNADFFSDFAPAVWYSARKLPIPEELIVSSMAIKSKKRALHYKNSKGSV